MCVRALGCVYLQRLKMSQVVEVAGTNVEERVVGDISTNNKWVNVDILCQLTLFV